VDFCVFSVNILTEKHRTNNFYQYIDKICEYDEKIVNINCSVPNTYTKCTEIRFEDGVFLETYPCFMGERKAKNKWFV